MLLLVSLFLRFIHRKSLFHQRQEVFWPLRCSHCARAVRPSPRTIQDDKEQSSLLLYEHVVPLHKQFLSSPILEDDSTELDTSTTSTTLTNLDDFLDGLSNASDLEPVSSFRTNRSVSDTIHNDNSVVTDAPTMFTRQKLYSTPHKSLLKIFCILEIALIMNQLYIVIGDVVCMGYGGPDIVLVSQCLHGFISIHSVSIVFLSLYYDAVFTQRPKLCYFLAIVLANCVWISSIKISNPTNALNNYPYYQLNKHCKINVTVSFEASDEIIQSCLAESGIVGAAMTWQMWSNMLPLSILQLEDGKPLFQSYTGIPGRSSSQTVMILLKKFSSWKEFCRDGHDSEKQFLLGCDPLKRMKRKLFRYYVIIFTFSVSYIIVRFYVSVGIPDVTESTKTYIISSAARQKGLSSCVHQKHAFRDNRICSV